MSDLLDLTVSAAHVAGALLAERAGHPGRTSTKSSDVDMVTEFDIAAGVLIARELASGDPGTPLVIEEPEVYALAGVREGALDAPAVWVVDPIDGTTSFIHGFPAFSVSIARLEYGQPVLGVVFNVPLAETFGAEAGLGATCNGAPISASDAETVDRSLVVTGFPYDRGAPLTRQLAVLGAMLRTVHGIRRDGSAAVDCCHVACGRADAFWEFGLRPWDTSAGMLIAREAGAIISALDGSPWSPGVPDVLVAAPRLYPVILEAIRASDPGPL